MITLILMTLKPKSLPAVLLAVVLGAGADVLVGRQIAELIIRSAQ